MKAKNIFQLHVHTCVHTYTHTSSPGHGNACTCEPLCYALLFSSSCALNGQIQSFIKKKKLHDWLKEVKPHTKAIWGKRKKNLLVLADFFFFWPEKKIEISFNSILKQDYRNLKVTTWLSSLTQWWTSVLTDHDLVLTNVVSAQPEGITTRCLQYPKFPPWSLMFI